MSDKIEFLDDGVYAGDRKVDATFHPYDFPVTNPNYTIFRSENDGNEKPVTNFRLHFLTIMVTLKIVIVGVIAFGLVLAGILLVPDPWGFVLGFSSVTIIGVYWVTYNEIKRKHQ